MIQVFTWPDQGPHKAKFLVVVFKARWESMSMFSVSAIVAPVGGIEGMESAIETGSRPFDSSYSKLFPAGRGTARRHPNDKDDPRKAYRIALNRATWTALAAMGQGNMWDETYYASKPKPRKTFLIRLEPDGLHVTDQKSRPLSLPGRCDGLAPVALLPRIIAHAMAQRATVGLTFGFRHGLTLMYGQQNLSVPHPVFGWKMVYVRPKPALDGEPDDFDVVEQAFRDAQAAAEGFTAKARQLLGVA